MVLGKTRFLVAQVAMSSPEDTTSVVDSVSPTTCPNTETPSADSKALAIKNASKSHQIEVAVHSPKDEKNQHDDDFPEGGLRAWLVVAGAFLTLIPAFGFMTSIGTFQAYWSHHMLSHHSGSDIGWIPSLYTYLTLALGICVGPLFDRYGPRWILLSGCVLYVAMVFLLAECTELWQMLLCCGLLGGICAAMIGTTALGAVAHWFKARRGLASGVAMAGSSFGGFVLPVVLEETHDRYGYVWTVRIFGFIALFCLAVGNLLIRARLPPRRHTTKSSAVAEVFSLAVYRDLRVALLIVSIFGMETVLFAGLGLLPSFARLHNHSDDTGFYLISTMNGVSCLGRLLPGYYSDKIGRFNMLAIMIAFTLVSMLALWLPLGGNLGALYAFAGLFGFGTGSWMALIPACIGQLCRADEFGRYYGSVYFVGSLATLVCIPISSQLIEDVGPTAMVVFLSAVLAWSLAFFMLSRWACLERRWVLWEMI